MTDEHAARRLDRELALGRGPTGAPEALDADVRQRLELARELDGLDLTRDSRGPEWVRRQVAEARSPTPETPHPRTWVMRRPILAAALAVAGALLLVALFAPDTLAALARPVRQLLDVIWVGDRTVVFKDPPRSGSTTDAGGFAEAYIDRGRWHLDTRHYGRYSGWGPEGSWAPPGEPRPAAEMTELRPASTQEELRALTPLELPFSTHVHRGREIRFDHAYAAPDGRVFVLFGSGENELFLIMIPLKDHGAVVSGPNRQPEELLVNGRKAVWLPDPRPDEPAYDVFTPGYFARPQLELSTLLWEAGDVSYALKGRSLTREEAIAFLRSIPQSGDPARTESDRPSRPGPRDPP